MATYPNNPNTYPHHVPPAAQRVFIEGTCYAKAIEPNNPTTYPNCRNRLHP
jgi:hypothetical protein